MKPFIILLVFKLTIHKKKKAYLCLEIVLYAENIKFPMQIWESSISAAMHGSTPIITLNRCKNFAEQMHA